MTPEVHWALATTTLGLVVIGAGDAGVSWLSFGEDRGGMRAHFSGSRLVEGGALVTALRDRVVAAIEAPSETMRDIPVAPRGTPFQQQVWQALRAIPCGQTRSYGDLAGAFGKPGQAAPSAARTRPTALRC